MSDLFDILGAANTHGAGLLLLAWLVWEVRLTRKNFTRHTHDAKGRVIIEAHAE